MKTIFLVIAATLSFSAAAKAEVATCTDGFRTITLESTTGLATLNGFDLVGIKSGTEYSCREPVAAGGPGTWACRNLENSSDGVVVREYNWFGLTYLQLLSQAGLTVFNGACARNR